MSEKEKTEIIKVPVNVELNVPISQTLFADSMRHSQMFWETIKPRLDIGQLIESFVKDRKEFIVEFYGSPPKTFDEFMALVNKHRKDAGESK